MESRELKRFKNKEDRTVKSMVESRDPEIIYTIVDAIFYGIDNGLTSVDCFEIESADSIITFKMSRDEWNLCLEKRLDDMISYEDYESCSRIQRYTKILEQRYIEPQKDI